MPSSKLSLYAQYHVDYSKIGRALAHPARLRIIEILRLNSFARNTDLVKSLKLTQPAISNHINKLIDADLVELSFLPNSSTNISLKVGGLEKVRDFMNEYLLD